MTHVKERKNSNNLRDERNSHILMKALDWLYGKAAHGSQWFKSAKEIAEECLAGEGTMDEKVDRFIRRQVFKSGACGFITGLGGLPTLPITLPTNFASVTFIHLQTGIVIACMYGYHPENDIVRTFVYVCLCGESAFTGLKKIWLTVGKKLPMKLLKKIPARIIIAINKKVGFRLLTKFGTKGAVNLHKAVPFVGGIIGGAIDASSTRLVGKIAKKIFGSSRK
ncbi:MAG: EcsC family protein [Bacteroidota bacterium]|nr:EcsC family protein [Bacteroidota bacterium]